MNDIYIGALTTAYTALKKNRSKRKIMKQIIRGAFTLLALCYTAYLMSLSDCMMTNQNIVSLDLLIIS